MKRFILRSIFSCTIIGLVSSCATTGSVIIATPEVLAPNESQTFWGFNYSPNVIGIYGLTGLTFQHEKGSESGHTYGFGVDINTKYQYARVNTTTTSIFYDSSGNYFTETYNSNRNLGLNLIQASAFGYQKRKLNDRMFLQLIGGLAFVKTLGVGLFDNNIGYEDEYSQYISAYYRPTLSIEMYRTLKSRHFFNLSVKHNLNIGKQSVEQLNNFTTGIMYAVENKGKKNNNSIFWLSLNVMADQKWYNVIPNMEAGISVKFKPKNKQNIK